MRHVVGFRSTTAVLQVSTSNTFQWKKVLDPAIADIDAYLQLEKVLFSFT
jgi:hypothetical protein